MKRQKWVPVLTAILLLLQVFSLAGASAEMSANKHVPGLNAPHASTEPIDAVSIAVLSSDYRLPAPLVMDLRCKSVSFEKAFMGEFDALLVSNEKFSRLSKSSAGRQYFVDWLSRGKVLLVMDSSTIVLKDALHIDMPAMEVTTSQYLVSGVVRLTDGVFASGGVLLIKGRPYPLREKARDMRAYSANLISVKKRVTSAIGRSSYWQFEGVLSHFFDMCPFGKYIETVYAERATDDGSPSHDFWSAQIDQKTVGGYSACGSSFQASRLWTLADAGVYRGQLLYRYGPTTTNASKTSRKSLGLTAEYGGAPISSGKSVAFPSTDVYVVDHSDFSAQRAEWEFVYSHGSDPAKYTCLSKLSVSVRTAEGRRLNLHRTINTYWWRHWWDREYHLFDGWYLHF